MRKPCSLGQFFLPTSLLVWMLSTQPSAAAPFIVVEEEARLLPTGVENWFAPEDVAIDGDRIVILRGSAIDRASVYLFERDASNQWRDRGQLIEVTHRFEGGARELIDIQGNVIAFITPNMLHVLELVGGAWQHHTLTADSQGRLMAGEVSIDGNRIVVSGASQNHEALIFEKNAAGTWGYAGSATGDPLFRDVQWNGLPFRGADVAIAADNIVLGTPFGDDDPAHDRAIVFRQSGGGWGQSQIIERDTADLTAFAGGVSLGIDLLALDGRRGSNAAGLEYGLGVYTRSGSAWNLHDFAYLPRRPDQPSPPQDHAISGDLIAVAQSDDDRNGVTVYRRTSDGVQLIAKLHTSLIDLPPSGLRVIYHVDISDRTVVAAAGGSVWVFRLPENLEPPTLRQEDFQQGNAGDWAPFPANAWSVVSAGGSRVYRQSSLAGDARTLVGNMDWTNQSIQVDVTPRAFEGTNRWFGLIVRYTDPSNYYYLTVRQTNEVRLRRMLNGTFSDLSYGIHTVQLNRPYRLRLEAVGTRIRAYVDDTLALEAIDDTLTHGSAGLATYKARADYDNVLISPNPKQTVRADDFMQFAAFNWTLSGGQWAFPPDFYPPPDEPDPYADLRVLRQTLARGDARAIAGPPLDDQRVKVRVSATTFATNGWFGLIGRHVDHSNYYYLKVATNGEVALRKLVNGQIAELARTNRTILPNRTYTLELQAVGNRLLAYIDGAFVLQATDSSHPEGRYGLMTYNAAAEFDDFEVWQP